MKIVSHLTIFCIFEIFVSSSIIYLSSNSSDTNNSEKGNIFNPFLNLSEAIDFGFDILDQNSSINELVFLFIGENFTIYDNISKPNAFQQWETTLNRNISIIISSEKCGIQEICTEKFFLILNTQNLSFYSPSTLKLMNIIIDAQNSDGNSVVESSCQFQNSFDIYNNDCYLKKISSITRTTIIEKNLFEIEINSNFFLHNFEIRNLFSIDESWYYSYIVKASFACNIEINNSSFINIYLKESLVGTFDDGNLYVENTTFINIDPFSYKEIRNQIFPYIFYVGHLGNFNFSLNGSIFSNTQFILFSSSSKNLIKNSNFTIKIATTSLVSSLTYGVLYFTNTNFSSIILENNNFTTKYENNISGLNKISLIYLPDNAQFLLKTCLFSNLILREGSIYLGGLNSNVSFIDNEFSNVNHTCSEQPSTNCLYYLFDFNSLCLILISNNTFSNILISYDVEFLRFYSTNRVNMTHNIFKNIRSINSNNNLMSFFSSNTIYFNKILVQNYSVGFSGIFILMNSRNLIYFNNSIFVGNNAANQGGMVLYFTNTNTFICDTVWFSSMCGLFRNNIYYLSNNNGYYNNVYIYNLTGGRGGASSMANNNNKLIIHSSFMYNLYTTNQGSLIYVINSNNNIYINSSKAYDLYAVQDAGLAYIESSHTLTIENTLIFNAYANMYGGVISTLNSNSFSIKNSIFIQARSQSNGGVVNLIQNNNITVFNSSFIGCSSLKSQGGVLYSFQNNIVLFDNITFENNQAEQEGGAFFFDNQNLFNFTNARVNISISYSDAGFLMAKQDNLININQCNFSNMQSILDGGFLKLTKNNNINLVDLQLFNVSSIQNGGVFYLDTSNIFFLIDSFVSLTNGYKGGIFGLSLKNEINVHNIEFSLSNCSFQGAGVFADKFNKLNYYNCKFNGFYNTIGDGGLFYLNYDNQLFLFNSSVKNVNTKNNGGFLYSFQNNIMNITKNQIETLASANEGSLIAFYKNNSIFFESVAVKNSIYYGMVYLEENNSFFMQDTNFSITAAEKNSYFFYLENGNLGLLENCNILFSNSSENSVLLFFVLQNQDQIFVNKTPISFDSCATFISLKQNSIFSIIYFKLVNFAGNNLKSTFIILDQNSSFTAKQFYLKFDEIYQIFLAQNSNITLIDFQFFISKQNINFIYAKNSSILLKNGHFEKYALKNSTQNFIFYDCHIYLNKVNIIGFSFFDLGGAGILYNSSFYAIYSNFLINKSWKNGGLFSFIYTNDSGNSSQYNISIKKTILIQNEAFSHGGAFYIENPYYDNSNVNVSISRTKLELNIANRGAGLYSINTQHNSLNNVNFTRNKAIAFHNISKGGALFFSSKNESKPFDINILNCRFKSNQAFIGGVLYTEGLPSNSIKIKGNKFYNNFAKYYGNNFATDTYKLRFFTLEKNLPSSSYIDDNFLFYHLNSVKSGDNSKQCLLKINGYDRYGSITYGTDENLKQAFTITKTSPQLHSNSFNFMMLDGFICLASPITRKELPLMESFSYEIQTNLPQNETLYLNISLKTCDIGDRLNENNECVPCDIDTYSFVTNFDTYSQMCSVCTGDVFHCFGGGNYTALPGYWRFNNKSPFFYSCLNSISCVGDNRNFSDPLTLYLDIYSKGVCAQGYGGILCSDCIEGYGHTDNFSCVSCKDETYYLNVLGNLIARIVFAIYLINIAANMCLSLMTDQPRNDRVIATNLLKILTNHMQILGIIMKFPISIPATILSSASIFLSITPNVSEAFSLECLLKSLNMNVSILYFKLISASFYPFVLVIFYLLSTKIISKISCLKSKNSNDKITIISILNKKTITYFELTQTIFSLVCLTCYADIANMALAMFGCVTLSDGIKEEKLLYLDLRINCEGTYHQIWVKQLSVPIIIFFMFIYPLYIILMILRGLYLKPAKMEKKFYFKFGYFFYAYKKKFFFWDFVILIRKLLLIFINHFFFTRITNDDSSNYSIIIVLLVITLAFVLNNSCKPFHGENFGFINTIEEFSLIVSFLTVISLLIIITSKDAGGNLETFLFILGILLNLLFFVLWLKNYYQYYFKRKVFGLINILKKSNKSTLRVAEKTIKNPSDGKTIEKKAENSVTRNQTKVIKIMSKNPENKKIFPGGKIINQ